MKELPPPHVPIKTVGEAYELLLEKAHQSGAVVHHMIDEIRGDIVAFLK